MWVNIPYIEHLGIDKPGLSLTHVDTEGDVHPSKKIGSSNGCNIKDGARTPRNGG